MAGHPIASRNTVYVVDTVANATLGVIPRTRPISGSASGVAQNAQCSKHYRQIGIITAAAFGRPGRRSAIAHTDQSGPFMAEPTTGR